jgi:hypothetical protein
MTKLGFALVAAVALTVMVAPSVFAANEYCVIRNALGQSGITDGVPTYGWFKVSDASCFASLDAAERDIGTGKSAPMISGGYTVFHSNPQATPRSQGLPVMSEGIP